MPFKKSKPNYKKISKYTFPIGVLIASIIIATSYVKENTVTTSTNEVNLNSTIVIDAGHGGIDGGAVGINGEIEKDINLNIALTLRDMLQVNGFKVVMTRVEDTSLNDSNLTKVSEMKSSDLKNRMKLIEEYPNALVILVHQNHYTEEKYSGAQMFYGHLNAESEILAQNLQISIHSYLQPENSRQIKESTSSVYLLHNTPNPIVLAECGFLSNYEEAKLLSTEDYQQKMAFAIFSGIINYFDNDGNL